MLRPEIDRLLGRQNDDGGWGQLRNLPSDPYATGQALYVLSQAGVPPARAEVRRGVGFLLAPASRRVLADDAPRPSGGEALHQRGPHHLFRLRVGHARLVAVRAAARRGRLDSGPSSRSDGPAQCPPAESARLRRWGQPGGLPDRLAHLVPDLRGSRGGAQEKPASAVPGRDATGGTVLGVRDTRFTLNGEPTFLLGMSYYGALVSPEEFVCRDLADLERHGFNWVSVWATWGAFDRDVSAVNAGGGPRESFLGRLDGWSPSATAAGWSWTSRSRAATARKGVPPGPRGPPSGRRDARRRAEGAPQLVPRSRERAGRPRCAARAGRRAQGTSRAGPAARPGAAGHGLVRGARPRRGGPEGGDADDRSRFRRPPSAAGCRLGRPDRGQDPRVPRDDASDRPVGSGALPGAVPPGLRPLAAEGERLPRRPARRRGRRGCRVVLPQRLQPRSPGGTPATLVRSPRPAPVRPARRAGTGGRRPGRGGDASCAGLARISSSAPFRLARPALGPRPGGLRPHRPGGPGPRRRPRLRLRRPHPAARATLLVRVPRARRLGPPRRGDGLPVRRRPGRPGRRRRRLGRPRLQRRVVPQPGQAPRGCLRAHPLRREGRGRRTTSWSPTSTATTVRTS